MSLTTISGEIQAQPLNDNFSFLNTSKFTGESIYNVKDDAFGANGDGITDDTNAIQVAINTAAINGGGIVFLPEGTYLISSELTITTNNIHLIGIYGASTITCNSSTKDMIQIGNGITQIYNCYIKGLVLQKSVVSTDGYAINFNYVAICGINEVRIYGDNKIYGGIKITRGSYMFIEKPYIQNTLFYGIYTVGTGIGADRCIDIKISKGRIVGIQTDAIYISDYSEAIWITDTEIFQHIGYAIKVNPSVQIGNLFFYNVNIEGTLGSGIYLEYCTNVQFMKTWIGCSAGNPFFIETNANTISINDCLISASGDFDAIIAKGDAIQIDGNIITGITTKTSSGIYVDSTVSQISITNNIIRQFSEYGIEIINGSGLIQIIGNNFKSITTSYITGDSGSTTRQIHISGNMSDTSRTVASSATITLPLGRDFLRVSGTTNIDTITASWPERTITLVFDGILTVGDGTGNLVLAGNFTTTSSDILTLVCDGVNWFEVSRSIN